MTWKRWTACVLAAVFLVLSGCAPQADPSQSQSQDQNQSQQTTAPSYNPAVGQVRIYTCDPALQEGFTALAEQYYQETGIPVVVTLAQGSCQESLQQALSGQEAPTLFCLHSAQAVSQLADSLYDLSGTLAHTQLISPDFAVTQEDKVLALAADTQGYGLIYNAGLLARAGFTRSDITDFSQLQLVSQHITTQDLGFGAFAPPDLTAASHKGAACLLSGIGETADGLQAFWDLYIQNGGGTAQGLTALVESESIFYLGGTWDHESLESLGSSNLDILPAYTPDGGSLGYTVELCWAVNGKTANVDRERTLEFLNWLVTAQKEGAPVDTLGLFAPFQDAVSYEDPLEKKLREYMATEPIYVRWQCCEALGAEGLSSLNETLAQYAADPTPENWALVTALLS